MDKLVKMIKVDKLVNFLKLDKIQLKLVKSPKSR